MTNVIAMSSYPSTGLAGRLFYLEWWDYCSKEYAYNRTSTYNSV